MPNIEPDQWPPQACGMPALTFDPTENMATLVLNVTFTGGLPEHHQAASFAKNFVRLTEVAVTEYSIAHQRFRSAFNPGGSKTFAIIGAVNHMEQCILALRRALRYANHRKGVRLPKSIVNSKKVRKAVTDIRNAIEHTDSRLIKGNIAKGEAMIMKIKSDRVELDGNTILYVDLAEWLTELNSMAEVVASYNPGT